MSRYSDAAGIDTALATLATNYAAWRANAGASPAVFADYLVSWAALQDQAIAARLSQGVGGTLASGTARRAFADADNTG